MQTRRWILVLGLSSSIALAVGIPVMALTLRMSTEVVTGQVVSVVPADQVIVLREGSGESSPGADQIAIHLHVGQRIELAHGSESLGAVTSGQRIRARVSTHARHEARWLVVDP